MHNPPSFIWFLMSLSGRCTCCKSKTVENSVSVEMSNRRAALAAFLEAEGGGEPVVMEEGTVRTERTIAVSAEAEVLQSPDKVTNPGEERVNAQEDLAIMATIMSNDQVTDTTGRTVATTKLHPPSPKSFVNPLYSSRLSTTRLAVETTDQPATSHVSSSRPHSVNVMMNPFWKASPRAVPRMTAACDSVGRPRDVMDSEFNNEDNEDGEEDLDPLHLYRRVGGKIRYLKEQMEDEAVMMGRLADGRSIQRSQYVKNYVSAVVKAKRKKVKKVEEGKESTEKPEDQSLASD